ncbi:MAG: Putative two-component response regulator [uncultured Sulfurovum sp.]|uniref:Two-component response regulator n=1 Tax=uncultured Sulfurovum sp. TaxID=269237 RepID=A0A6S6U284_9BACT|nr:MAG: Putative two-component response regulator [uncultured Sulfurovum sp.]
MNKISLLYIEDDKDIQEIYLDLINEEVDRVHLAHDGEEGYALYLNIKPDIILLDINMPKVDGLSLAKKIREADSKVKIIITTAYGEQDKLLQAIELYLIKYILKPIDPKILKEALLKAKSEVLASREDEVASEKIFSLDEEHIWNFDTEKLYENSIEVKLTKNERRLLKLLSTNENKVFTFFEIFDYISYEDFDKSYDAGQVRALVKLLRKKIPKESVLNIYGEGYRFNPLKEHSSGASRIV